MDKRKGKALPVRAMTA